MPGYILMNFFAYALINAFTPGPGNILALNTVSNYGVRKGRFLFYGIFLGYYIVQGICTVIVFGISNFLPSLLDGMKYVGAAYIVWLAIHIACSKPELASDDKPASFLKGFLLQFVNVKIYLFGISALTGYITDYSTQFVILLFAGMFIATIGTVATIAWIGIGVVLQNLYRRHFRMINIILACSLLECAYSMVK